ncbi:MAG: hypothetical protein M1825_001555 [Sarcosagium campestre]|nr:MAG: hypothetical protein M1825_001555 [Sarcosagium campestre]
MATDSSQLEPLNEVERLGVSLIRILGGNPGKFTLQGNDSIKCTEILTITTGHVVLKTATNQTWFNTLGTNTYLVGQGPARLLIDTGEGRSSWIRALKRVLDAEGTTVTHAILTHWHPDHVGGVNDLRTVCPNVIVHKYPSENSGDIDVDESIKNGQKFEVEGATLRAVHCPGHTSDHVALVFEQEDAIFTGDNVLGHGTAVFEDLKLYIESLETMRTQFSGRAYPAHGAVVVDGAERIGQYIAHRKMREEQILRVMQQMNTKGSSESPGWLPIDIVKVLYADVSQDLYPAAERGVWQVLRKLESEGKTTLLAGSDEWKLREQANI